MCNGQIDLQRPTRSERRHGFQPPYYTVYVYRCPDCQRERFIRARCFIGKTPRPDIGAVVCQFQGSTTRLVAKDGG